MRRPWFALFAVLALAAAPGDADAQGRGRGGPPPGPPPSGRAAAVQDLTGTWVSVVTEHWHLRMLVPPVGDFSMLPLNNEARRIANMWDPSEVSDADQCKPYGAAAIMRVPGRLNIHWTDDDTLQMDIDSGTQTRMFHFNSAVPARQGLEWQGYSVASWEPLVRGRGRGAPPPTQLKVTTTRMRAGFLRRNGIPYSENAVLDEYYDRFTEPNGDEWLVVTTIVTDPEYLTQPYATTNHFRKIADQSGWDPTPCQADQAR